MMSYESTTYDREEQAHAVAVAIIMDPMVEEDRIVREIEYKEGPEANDRWIIHILHGGSPNTISMYEQDCKPKIKKLRVGDKINVTLSDMEVRLSTGGTTVMSVKSANGDMLYQSSGIYKNLVSMLK